MSYTEHKHECKHKTCKYHMPAWSPYGCNYADITGKTRTGQLPPEQLDPANCPLYKKGQRVMVTLEPLQFPGSNPKKDVDRARSNSGGKTKYDWDRARELYGDGATDRQIAAALGCNPHTVYHWRQRSGYLPKNEG